MVDKPTKTPLMVRIARALFFLNALIWMVFGVAGLVRVTDGYRGQAVIAAMMFGNALLMLVSGLWIGKSRKVSFFFALAVLAINIILTFTDEFGLYDFGTLVLI